MKYFLMVLRQALPTTNEVATEVQLLPYGEIKSGDGSVSIITKEVLLEIIKRFDARENDLVIDYEHQTLTGSEAPAAGWIKRLFVKDDGLWAEVEWTRRGESQVKEKEYRYLSPVIMAKKKDSKGRLIPEVLHSAALTNDPAIDGMVPLAAKSHFENLNKESVMDLEKLCKALGLATGSSEEEVMKAVIAFKAKADKGPKTKEVIPEGVTEALGLAKDASASEVKATVLAMKQGANTDRDKDLNQVKVELAEMKAEKLVCKAMDDGKITADQKEWALKYAINDREGFVLYASKAPQVVPMGETKPGPNKETEVITEEIQGMAVMFGNSNEDLVKFGGLKEAS